MFFPSYVIFLQNVAKMLAIFIAKNYLGVKHDWKKDANYPDIDISFHITTFMWIRNGNWQHLLIVILGKHQIRILNAYKYYLIPVLILMSIKLLSSHSASYMLRIAPHFVFGRPSLKVYEKQFCRDARKHFTIHMGSRYLGICWNLHHHFPTIQPEHRTWVAPFLCVREQCWLFWIIWINTGKFILCLICICEDMLCILHREIDCTKK